MPETRRRWAVVGASGFVGAALTGRLHQQGEDVVAVQAPRTLLPPRTPPASIARLVDVRYAADFAALRAQFEGVDIVVNAAGVATPDSGEDEALYGGNALLPVLVARAAEAAGVARFIHLSSAAVQGRRAVLDESEEHAPFSPYSRSKAIGEDALIALQRNRQPGKGSVVIVRATSVQGDCRSTTARLRALAQSPWASVAGRGDRPTIVSSIGELTTFLVAVGRWTGPVPVIVLQPWEGLTTSGALRALGARRVRHFPMPLCRAALVAGFGLSRALPRVSGPVRRVEVLWLGQEQRASWARSVGLERPDAAPAVFLRGLQEQAS